MRAGTRAGGTSPGLGDRSLRELGWTQERAASFKAYAQDGLLPGRVVSSSGALHVQTADGPIEAILQGRWRRPTDGDDRLPSIGDWLALEALPDEPGRALVRDILPRQGTFLRSRASDGRAQVLATNLDLVFLVSGLDHDLNPRRIERYLLLAIQAGVMPIVVLNKVDIAVDLTRAVSEVHAVASGTRVILSSALTGAGVDELRSHLPPGSTACLLGSSGVGKSSLTNTLLGEDRQVVRALRDDDSRGRHTTTHRELFVIPGGGSLIDTPGLRTVGVLGDEAALESSFEDITDFARRCRFSDCGHDSEPGCAVRSAIEAGVIPAARLASHRKLEAELRSAALRSDVRQERAEGRRLGRLYRQHGQRVERARRGEG
jgi:ribosome biogenesis GTPase